MGENDGLLLLRKQFDPRHISKLPKPTKFQTEEVRGDPKKGVRCRDCGTWHHPNVVHLDYVGHAALTDRLLDADIGWTWEPLAYTDQGLPLFDQSGGLWIKLTVCGMTRLGYGNAESKARMDAGAREKEVIGDALRNAAMRFGAALDLWHKGELHGPSEGEPIKTSEPELKAYTDEVKSDFDKLITDGDDIGMYVFRVLLKNESTFGKLYHSFTKDKGKYQQVVQKLYADGDEKMRNLSVNLESSIEADDRCAVLEILDGLGGDARKVLTDMLSPGAYKLLLSMVKS